MKLNDNLKQILKERNLNVHQLARGANVNHENIYKILKEKKIADYLGLTIDELLK